MKLLTSFLMLGCSLAVLSQTAKGQESQFTFDSDLDSLTSTNAVWQWSNREVFPWLLPDGPDGFAVLYIPGPGDTLYESELDIQNGFDYEIVYFINSQEAGTTVLKIQQLDVDGTVIEDINEYQSDPTNDQWMTATGTFAGTGAPSRFGVFCQTSSINFVNSAFYGCAVDSITLNVHPAQTTTEEPVDTTSAASVPGDVIDYNFENSTQGWVLGSSNGATWQRGFYGSTVFGVGPPSGDYVLQVLPQDVYSGTVVATSPRLRVGDLGAVRVTVYFYIGGSVDYPAYLKLRTRLSYTTYDEDPIINMDPWGDQMNMAWLNSAAVVEGIAPGTEFNLILEGNLGIDNLLSRIFVSQIVVEGVTEVEYEETEIFDFSDGLVGWQAGSMDGGKWQVVAYSELPPGLGIPAPTSNYLLMVDRYDIHSGLITIESPPLSLLPGSEKLLQIRLLIKGSQVYPVIFRLNLKSLDGHYDPLPFIDLTPQGDANLQTWVSLRQLITIPADPRNSYFQLVFEVDLGGDLNNLIAIDTFEVRTR